MSPFNASFVCRQQILHVIYMIVVKVELFFGSLGRRVQVTQVPSEGYVKGSGSRSWTLEKWLVSEAEVWIIVLLDSRWVIRLDARLVPWYCCMWTLKLHLCFNLLPLAEHFRTSYQHFLFQRASKRCSLVCEVKEVQLVLRTKWFASCQT